MSWLNAIPIVGNMVQGAINTYTGMANVQATKDINEKNIVATRENNALARQWALDDWNRTNQYNSPLQQMQRLREAGLNPRLVYNSGAQNTAQMISRTQPQTPNLNVPHMPPIQLPDFGGALSQIYQMQNIKADLANKEVQNKLLSQNLDKGNLDIASKVLKNEKDSFALGVAKELRDTTLQSVRNKNELTLASTAKVQADTAKTVEETKMIPLKYELQKQSFKLQKATSEAQIAAINAETARKVFELSNIAPAQKQKLEQEIKNLELSGELKQWDLRLRSAGINPSDPSYVRIIVAMVYKLADQFGIDLGDMPVTPGDLIRSGKGNTGTPDPRDPWFMPKK